MELKNGGNRGLCGGFDDINGPDAVGKSCHCRNWFVVCMMTYCFPHRADGDVTEVM